MSHSLNMLASWNVSAISEYPFMFEGEVGRVSDCNIMHNQWAGRSCLTMRGKGRQDSRTSYWRPGEPRDSRKLNIRANQEKLFLLSQNSEGTWKSHIKNPRILQQTLPGGNKQGKEWPEIACRPRRPEQNQEIPWGTADRAAQVSVRQLGTLSRIGCSQKKTFLKMTVQWKWALLLKFCPMVYCQGAICLQDPARLWQSWRLDLPECTSGLGFRVDAGLCSNSGCLAKNDNKMTFSNFGHFPISSEPSPLVLSHFPRIGAPCRDLAAVSMWEPN